MPIQFDTETLRRCAQETKALIVTEDHYEAGGIGETVKAALSGSSQPIISLAVRKMPQSGTPQELLEYEEIDRKAIIRKVQQLQNSAQKNLLQQK